MRTRPPLCLGIVLAFSSVLSRPVAADVRLPALFADNAVLQRDIPVPVWGWADKDEQVTVKIGDQTKTATPDAATGKWTVKIGPFAAGGPYTLTVSGKNTLTLKNVLVGDVWLCSGQSNMQLILGRLRRAKEEEAAATYPKIRLMGVFNRGSGTPLDEFKVDDPWEECSPKAAANFSAVAYFFGRELYKNLDVPIGLIQCCYNNSSCEAWTPRSALEGNPIFKPKLDRQDYYVNEWVSGAAHAHAMEAWKKAVAKAKAENKEPPPEPPPSPGDPRADPRVNNIGAGNLYNGMVHATAPYGIRGVIWYQGECTPNLYWARQYRTLFPTLIKAWRAKWQEGDFPFYFVQLANYRETKPEPKEPAESVWAELREAQLMTLKVPATGMAVAIDIGDADNIHPDNKLDVGKRLALWALAKTYGKKDLVYSGPLYKSFEVKDDKVIISFDYVHGGLVAKGGDRLKGFAIAGSDKKFVWADARIEGDQVVVSSPAVKSPVAVRYAWAENPECNLYNKSELPASPFRTDDWKGITAEQ